jgi:urea transport system substrate-binding protein
MTISVQTWNRAKQGLLLAGVAVVAACKGGGDAPAGDGVAVGVLQSLTGTMAISEITVKNAEMLAIEEINASGGVLGKRSMP